MDFLPKIDDSVFGGDHLWTSYWGDHTGRKGKLNMKNFHPNHLHNDNTSRRNSNFEKQTSRFEIPLSSILGGFEPVFVRPPSHQG